MDSTVFFSLSDNLYYLDQLGSVDDQLVFLNSLSFNEAQYVSSRRDGQYVLLLVRCFYKDKFYFKQLKIYPGIVAKTFMNHRVVNLPRWLLNFGFCVNSHIVNYKLKRLCLDEEENTAAATTVGAVDPFPSEG